MSEQIILTLHRLVKRYPPDKVVLDGITLSFLHGAKIGVLGLAMNACRERDGFADERDRIVELVACARDLWPYAFEPEDEAERLRLRRATFRLIHLAQIETVTADG